MDEEKAIADVTSRQTTVRSEPANVSTIANNGSAPPRLVEAIRDAAKAEVGKPVVFIQHREEIAAAKAMVEDAENCSATLFLIKRTHKSKLENKRELVKADLGSEGEDFFRKLLLDQIDSMTADGKQYKDFALWCEPPYEEDVVPFISNFRSIPNLPAILSMIEKHTKVESVKKLGGQAITNVLAYCVEFKQNEHNRIVFFTKHNPSVMFSKKEPIFKLHNGIFNKIDYDIFTFNNAIDSIYFEADSINRMYVIGIGEFEAIFECSKRYKELSEKALETLTAYDFVQISPQVFGDITGKKRYLKKVAVLQQMGEFQRITLDDIQHSINRAGGKIKFGITNGKVVLDSEDAITDFIDVLKECIVASLRKDDKILRAPRTTEI